MNDRDLDDLLAQSGSAPEVRQNTLNDLVVSTRDRVRHQPSRPRRLAVIGLAVGGGVLLAAAASSSYWLKIAPFQSLEPDMYRSAAHVDTSYITANGTRESCEAFAELLHLSSHQAEAVNRVVATHKWGPIGQRAYDAAASSGSPADLESRRGSFIESQIRSVVVTSVEGVSPSPAGKAPAWNGWSEVCRVSNE